MHCFRRKFLPAAAITINLLLASTVGAVAAPQAAGVKAASTASPSEPRDKAATGATVLIGNSKGLDVSKPYGSHLKPILDRIKANSDQSSKIKHIVESYRSKIQPLREEYKQKRQDFLASMTSGGTAEIIMTKQVELSHLSSEISSRYCLMRLEIRRQLTPQQILEFEGYAREHGWNSR